MKVGKMYAIVKESFKILYEQSIDNFKGNYVVLLNNLMVSRILIHRTIVDKRKFRKRLRTSL